MTNTTAPHLDIQLLGGFRLTRDGLRRRDESVFRACRARAIPVGVTLGGGYAEDVADTVAIHLTTVRAAARVLETRGVLVSEARPRRLEDAYRITFLYWRRGDLDNASACFKSGAGLTASSARDVACASTASWRASRYIRFASVESPAAVVASPK